MNLWQKLPKTYKDPYHHPKKNIDTKRPTSYILRFCNAWHSLPYYSHHLSLGMHHVSEDLWKKDQISACYRHDDYRDLDVHI
jgi:hypothetical protein